MASAEFIGNVCDEKNKHMIVFAANVKQLSQALACLSASSAVRLWYNCMMEFSEDLSAITSNHH